ncbi:MAG: hypothetical protein ACR2OE_16890, partial [Thermomicrobiales bacterium]
MTADDLIGITWFDGEGNIVGADYATPMTYVIDAGDLLPVTQATLEFNPFQEEWNSVAFSICGDWMTQNMIDMGLLPGIEITEVKEDPGKDTYAMSCMLKNTTEVDVENATEVDVENATEVDVENATEVDVENATEVDVENATEVDVENAT